MKIETNKIEKQRTSNQVLYKLKFNEELFYITISSESKQSVDKIEITKEPTFEERREIFKLIYKQIYNLNEDFTKENIEK